MRIVDLIIKKREGFELNDQEIEFIIQKYVSGEIKDYQMSSFLTTIMFKGMTPKEIGKFTLEMMKSGRIIDLKSIKGIKVDKHSTGGVGDKTTLVVGPIIAALDVPVAKMSGRGLGHTGGTIDKLESIPGFSVALTEQEFIDQVNKIKIAVIGQTDDLVPADKKLYALRDVTGNVSSIPLIASSIMSKKLATGSDAILLDVKCGNGAFMTNVEEARKLASQMITIGKELNRDVRVEITNMSRPMGKSIGNKNEVLEAIRTLKGQGTSDFNELCYSACITILKQAKVTNDEKEAKKMIDEVIKSGKALDKFYEFIETQGGDVQKLKAKDFWNPKYKLDVLAENDGFMEISSALSFGIAASKLGAGRITKEDNIDFEAGIEINKKTNDEVKKGDLLFTLYSSKPIDMQIANELKDSYQINKQKVENKVILDRME
ncbi:pyrimidine-nucleoside phosphorylase [Mesomycoplasma lagogenitalium]|uniref:Pyrimidine-nucleoside phosphorylase n=1 Tax=Mesomycoplasma lagogenitalium TaxID=171286 RepID=A0ABY8LUA8_9BACT|nr:pyrimidine-nucleoside phosphorylase [Mesomycoplasma lagogenitalium]WGI36817.1 pyrimidine-nucleoside phosphorylase [Mesomycoplasma lagogenitalium]